MADKAIGVRLKQARENAGLTQKKVCEALEIPKTQTLSAYERGENNPTIEALKGLSKLYQVSIDWIVFGENLPTSKRKETIDYIRDLFYSAEKLGLSLCEERDCNGCPTDRYIINLQSFALHGFDCLVRDLYKLSTIRDLLDDDDYRALVDKKIKDDVVKSDNFEWGSLPF